MEDVIQILVFLVIVISVIFNKYKEVNANRPGQHVNEPDEPDFEEDYTDCDSNDQPELSMQQEQPEVIPQPMQAMQMQTMQANRRMQPSLDMEKTNSPLASTTVTPTKKSKVRLRTRGEARKAFIYSEIFNRKYE